MSRNRNAHLTGVVVLVSASLLAGAAASAAAPVDITHSGSQELRLRLSAGELDWVERDLPDAGVTRHIPRLEGFFVDAEPFAPLVPVYGSWIVLPPGTAPVAERVAEDWLALDGRDILRGALPVKRTDPATGRDVLDAEYVLPGAQPRNGVPALSAEEMDKALRGAATPPPLVIGEAVPWRGHRIAPVTVRPLEADADGRARRLLRTAEWRIRFVSDGKSVGAPGRLEPRDARFASMFLNGDLLDALPRERVASRVPVRTGRVGKALLAPEVRIPVTRTGLVYLRAGSLAAQGLLDGTGIDESHIRLYQRRYVAGQTPSYDEIEVPILMLGDGGDFGGDDAIVFYGLRVRDDGPFSLDGRDYDGCGDPHETFNPSTIDPVNNGNIYYLAAADPDGDPWARMETIMLESAAGAPEVSYPRIDYHEEDTHYGVLPYTNDADRNFWNAALATEPEKDLDLVNPVPGATNARLRAGVHGFGSTTWSLQLSLIRDDAEIVLDAFGADDAGATYDSGATLASDDLASAALRLSNTTSSSTHGYLDWYELSYDALYAARDDRLDFNCGTGTGARSIEVTGFSGGQILLVDISDPRAPRHVALSAANLADAGTTLSVTAEQAASAARRFAAVGGDPATALSGFPYFKASRVAYPDDPAAVTAPPDVLVITHPTFRAEAERWAEHRQARAPAPLEIHIVDVHAVFDWYGGGLKNPDAIKRLCAIARDEWGTWALQIFGDANENVKGLSDPNNLRDWVPSHLHVWFQGGYENELLPSDKWYATETDDPDYPYYTDVPAGMLVGRFPGNSVDEIAAMVDKVIAYETDTGDWKKRAVFVADDAWSDGYNISFTEQQYAVTEEEFEDTQELAAVNWETFAVAPPDGLGDDGFEAVRVYLSTYLEPLSPPHDQLRSRVEFSGHAETLALPDLLAAGSRGAALMHYQGHANDHLLAHEQILEDVGGSPFYREDASSFDNAGRPWFFVGLGCHITTWTRDGSTEMPPQDVPSLGEKFLRRADAGAVGTYASSGYEFLTPNAALVQVQFAQMLQRPPRGGITGETLRSRWVIGELMLASEAAFLALHPTYSTYRRAIAQYTLLGDALMVIDAGPPRVDVSLGWEPLEDGAELTALDETNELVLTVRAFDEAGVDRIVVSDDDGADLSGLAVGGTPAGADSDQRAEWEVRVPIPPQDYAITFDVYDTAAPDDAADHFSMTLNLPVAVTLHLGDALFVPGETPLPLQQDLDFAGRAVTAAYLAPEIELDLHGQNVTLVDKVLTRIDEHTVDMTFTARATGEGDAAVVLEIDGFGTVIPLQDGGTTIGAGIEDLHAFPNPVARDTRFLFTTGAAPSSGRITVYNVAGHVVKELPIGITDFVGGGHVIVPWDGRDAQGDELANGVYLYRVELSAPSGALASDMQRLVMMH